jgi:hypothetical protein
MFSNSLFVVFIIYSSLLCTPSDNDQSWTLSYTFHSCSGRCIKYIDVVRDDLVLRILLDKFDNVWSRMHLGVSVEVDSKTKYFVITFAHVTRYCQNGRSNDHLVGCFPHRKYDKDHMCNSCCYFRDIYVFFATFVPLKE